MKQLKGVTDVYGLKTSYDAESLWKLWLALEKTEMHSCARNILESAFYAALLRSDKKAPEEFLEYFDKRLAHKTAVLENQKLLAKRYVDYLNTGEE